LSVTFLLLFSKSSIVCLASIALGSTASIEHKTGPHIDRGHLAHGSAKSTLHPQSTHVSLRDLTTHSGNTVFIGFDLETHLC
jgi:hypothetical protein